mgnify:CR=1 FL=1
MDTWRRYGGAVALTPAVAALYQARAGQSIVAEIGAGTRIVVDVYEQTYVRRAD